MGGVFHGKAFYERSISWEGIYFMRGVFHGRAFIS
jgi:hypothetical protein